MRIFLNSYDGNAYFLKNGTLYAVPMPILEVKFRTEYTPDDYHGLLDTENQEVCQVEPIEQRHKEIINTLV